jgi:hypothetical protein
MSLGGRIARLARKIERLVVTDPRDVVAAGIEGQPTRGHMRAAGGVE